MARAYTLKVRMSESEVLARAAAAHGIELSYTDTWGHVHEASPEVLRALLAAQGFHAGNAEEIERQLAEREAAQWREPLEPTYVVRQDAAHFRMNIAAGRGGDTFKLEIEWENSELEHHWFWAPELQTLETRHVEGNEWIAKRVPLPKTLRLGYHRIRILVMREPEPEVFAEAHFIVCPRQARPAEERMAGLAVSLYGLRSARNWGCGDFTDLRALIDQFAAAGAAFLALNPLHAIANRQPYNTSPYLPQCVVLSQFYLSRCRARRRPAPRRRHARRDRGPARDRICRV